MFPALLDDSEGPELPIDTIGGDTPGGGTITEGLPVTVLGGKVGGGLCALVDEEDDDLMKVMRRSTPLLTIERVCCPSLRPDVEKSARSDEGGF